MKRKLPQWLLDATNNNAKSPKRNSPETLPTNSNDITDESEQHSNPINAESLQIQKNGTISVVPLENLLSQSRCGAKTNDSSRGLHASNNTDELRRTGIGIGTLLEVIKTEKIDQIEPDTSSSSNVAVKQEINEPSVNAVDTPSSTTTIPNEIQQVVIKPEIKDEPVDAATSTTTIPTIVPKIQNVTPVRRSCNYGVKCFRRNPDHRAEMAHPGDADYRRPDLPNAPIGTPACPWGAACYRRNPQHFIQLSHPPATTGVHNPTAAATTTVHVNTVPQPNLSTRRRQNTASINGVVRDDDDSGAEDEYDLEDPFLDDGSSDEYVPNEDESDEEEDTQDLMDS